MRGERRATPTTTTSDTNEGDNGDANFGGGGGGNDGSGNDGGAKTPTTIAEAPSVPYDSARAIMTLLLASFRGR